MATDVESIGTDAPALSKDYEKSSAMVEVVPDAKGKDDKKDKKEEESAATFGNFFVRRPIARNVQPR